ncbi:hypothetical protein PYCCODRAFT_1432856 [Trametes coccinea BRFM310]|uniref:Uncharacterized protein n=1 Tax=Trametes coccinea (strain BRFM310) TaxID=1353009 RepID=A0A1Y2IVE9_TRAC3|nr:hypothetical protein PYCCODRAFT_1432856 [Trametes coccinea BRFM310]
MSRVSSPRTKKPAQSTTVATSPDAQPQKKSESSPRRRRTGRKPSGAKARVPSAVVGADVRRRAAYGAGWGWTASDRVAGQRAEFGRVPRQVETWRAAESLVVAATA